MQNKNSETIERTRSPSPSTSNNDAKTSTPEIDESTRTSDVELETPTEENNYLTGSKLYLLVVGLSSAYFLITLNSTIVATVSRPLSNSRLSSLMGLTFAGNP